jgi:hypothetical protein
MSQYQCEPRAGLQAVMIPRSARRSSPRLNNSMTDDFEQPLTRTDASRTNQAHVLNTGADHEYRNLSQW